MGSDDEKLNWSLKSTIRLIKEYEKRPHLWDPHHDLYRVFTSKYEAWEEMSAIFGCDVVDLKKKMNSVLASHRRERAKIRNGGVSTWVLYPHLKFIPRYLENNTKPQYFDNAPSVVVEVQNQDDNYDNEQSNNEDDGSAETGRAEYLDVSTEDLHEEVFIKQEKSIPRVVYKERRPPRKLRPLKRKFATIATVPVRQPERRPTEKIDNQVLDALKSLRKSDLLKKKDECDSFGEYIANSLRKHDERTRSMIKHAINNIIFEQEMKKYNGQYSVTIVDENPLILSDQLQDDEVDE